MYRVDHTSDRKRKREDRNDPKKSREPERPAKGKHLEGSTNTTSQSLALFVADQRIAGRDPRHALFKYSKDDKMKQSKDHGDAQS